MKIRIAIAVLLAVAAVAVAVALLDEDVRKLELRRLPSRAAWQLPERVVEALAIESGQRVADLGAGDGYFVDYFSEAVGPAGRLYAVDVDADALESLRQKVASEGLANVEVVEGRLDDAGLPDGGVDLVFLCNVYHHIEDRVAYFDALRSDLAGEGRVAVVEPRTHGFGSFVSPGGHATDLDVLVGEMEQAGYRLESSLEFLPVQNLLVFRP